jgi:DNA-directed RNA polymerase specialized sigma24 family protein
MEKTLSERIIQFQRSGSGYEQIYKEVSLLIYQFPQVKYGFTDEDRGDFLLFILPRLQSMLSTYKDKGRPFEAYLFYTLKYQLKTFIKQKRHHKLRYGVSKRYEFWNSDNGGDRDCAAENTSARSYRSSPNIDRLLEDLLQIKKIQKKALRFRLLLLLLKCCEQVSERHIELVSEFTGKDITWLKACISELKLLQERRRERRALLIEKRNRFYFRLRCLETEKSMAGGSLQKAALNEKILQCTKRLSKLRKEIAAVPRTACNKDIAELLSLPKGTVDSSLYYLKHTVQKKKEAHDDDRHISARYTETS